MNAVAESIPAIAADQNQFVTVPSVKLASGLVEPSFVVGKFFTSRGAAGELIVNEAGLPVTRINYHATIEACVAAGYALLTLSQSQAIALDIASVAANWSGGAVGQGKLKQGLHKGSVRGAQLGSYVSADPEEDRSFVLSNGEIIFDAAGHLFTWLRDDVQGDENGIVARAFSADSPAVAGAPFSSMENGVGWYPDADDDWSGYALVRGGFWGDGDDAGVFALDGAIPDYAYDGVGFRWTKPSTGL